MSFVSKCAAAQCELDTLAATFLPWQLFPGTSVSIERIRSLIARDMDAVDAVIREKLYSDVDSSVR